MAIRLLHTKNGEPIPYYVHKGETTTQANGRWVDWNHKGFNQNVTLPSGKLKPIHPYIKSSINPVTKTRIGTFWYTHPTKMSYAHAYRVTPSNFSNSNMRTINRNKKQMQMQRQRQSQITQTNGSRTRSRSRSRNRSNFSPQTFLSKIFKRTSKIRK